MTVYHICREQTFYEPTKRFQTHHRPSQTPRHERKPHKQHQSRLPCHTIPRVAEAIRAEPRLVDGVDHQHAERGAYTWDPVDEVNVDVGAVEGGFGEGGRVDEEEEAKGELGGLC